MTKPKYHSSRSGWPSAKIDPELYARVAAYRERTGVPAHRIIADAIKAELDRLDKLAKSLGRK